MKIKKRLKKISRNLGDLQRDLSWFIRELLNNGCCLQQDYDKPSTGTTAPPGNWSPPSISNAAADEVTTGEP